MKTNNISPIFITGVERSGRAIVTKVVSMCNVFSGKCDIMGENEAIRKIFEESVKSYGKITTTFPFIKVNEVPYILKDEILKTLHKQGYVNDVPFIFKSHLLTNHWEALNKWYPNAKWIIVRREKEQIIQSCIKTDYMRMFKNIKLLNGLGFDNEHAGWDWWINKYEEQFVLMHKAKLFIHEINPNGIINGDFEQIKYIVNDCGLTWNPFIEETLNLTFKFYDDGHTSI